MKLVLCSEGFRTPNTIKACAELCNKSQSEISVAIINEGCAVESGDKRWVLENIQDTANNFGGEIDLINLLALSPEEIETRIAKKDVIFVLGGHTDYLMHVFNVSGLSKLLPKLLETKVYVGSSAGSMVMGRRVGTAAYKKIYDEGNDYGIKEYLGFVNFAIKPHFDSPDFPNNRAYILQEVAGGMDFPVYGFKDDCAYVVNGDDQMFIGSEPYKVR